MSATAMRTGDSNLFLDLVEAISNRHGQMDIRLEHLSLRLPLIPDAVEVNGTITVSVHMRELTDKEKAARVSKEIRALGT
jgi:hypothetical protein